MKRIVYISWLMLALSLAALFFAGYAVFTVPAQAAERIALATEQEQQLDRSAFADRLRSLALETKDPRAKLESAARLDIVSTVQMLEEAGRRAGAKATVADALSEGLVAPLPGGEELHAITYSFTASGSFASVMRLAELYENLPLAAQIVQLDIERSGDGATWNMGGRVRILTVMSDEL